MRYENTARREMRFSDDSARSWTVVNVFMKCFYLIFGLFLYLGAPMLGLKAKSFAAFTNVVLVVLLVVQFDSATTAHPVTWITTPIVSGFNAMLAYSNIYYQHVSYGFFIGVMYSLILFDVIARSLMTGWIPISAGVCFAALYLRFRSVTHFQLTVVLGALHILYGLAVMVDDGHYSKYHEIRSSGRDMNFYYFYPNSVLPLLSSSNGGEDAYYYGIVAIVACSLLLGLVRGNAEKIVARAFPKKRVKFSENPRQVFVFNPGDHDDEEGEKIESVSAQVPTFVDVFTAVIPVAAPQKLPSSFEAPTTKEDATAINAAAGEQVLRSAALT